MRILDVNAPLLTRDGKPYTEFDVDARGRIALEPAADGTAKPAKYQNQIGPDDVPVQVEKKLGQIINFGLDQQDQSIAAEEARKRFTLSCRITDAMRQGLSLSVDRNDEVRIAAAADLLVKASHMFVARIHEALEAMPAAKANGEAHATPAA